MTAGFLRDRLRQLGVLGVVAITASSAVVAGSLAPEALAKENCPWLTSDASPADKAVQVLENMTREEKLTMVHNAVTDPGGQSGAPAPLGAGATAAIPRLCIPQLILLDGPAGAGNGATGVTQLPSATVLSSTWNPELAYKYGAVVGNEVRAKGAQVSLGPALDIARDPRQGRSFETFGEDPYLVSEMGVKDIEGRQSQNVLAQAKHWAAYNQETYRNSPSSNVVADERTLQEVYFMPFDAAVNEADVASIMCSYNYINGFQACGNSYTINQVLKGQFGFGGFVTTDWTALTTSAAAANSGLDMEMPAGCLFGPRLETNISTGQVPETRLNNMVWRILSKMFKHHAFEPIEINSGVVTNGTHADVARQVAEQGAVLLKNSGALPVSPSTGSIAVIGSSAGKDVAASGGGSGHIIAEDVVTPYEGIKDLADSKGVEVLFNDGADSVAAANAAAAAEMAVVFVSQVSTEFIDQTNIDLVPADNAMIEAVAAANPNTVVVVNAGNPVSMPWLDRVNAVFSVGYPGQEYGTAFAALLFGDSNPSGKLTITFPPSLQEMPTASPEAFPGVGGNIQYNEGLDIGYKWYDRNNIAPLFPFGHGLSYTKFSFDALNIGTPAGNGDVTVTGKITNTGSRAGTDVVQLYLGAPESDTEAPVRSLKGFTRVSLEPGQSQTFSIKLNARDFSHWDTTTHQWVRTAGKYTIFVGDSSRNLPLNGAVSFSSTIVTSAPTPEAPAQQPQADELSIQDAVQCPLNLALNSNFVGQISGLAGQILRQYLEPGYELLRPVIGLPENMVMPQAVNPPTNP
ncbi:MAG: beta-glucosidase family protein [Mycobacteriaceae bacterium]